MGERISNLNIIFCSKYNFRFPKQEDISIRIRVERAIHDVIIQAVLAPDS